MPAQPWLWCSFSQRSVLVSGGSWHPLFSFQGGLQQFTVLCLHLSRPSPELKGCCVDGESAGVGSSCPLAGSPSGFLGGEGRLRKDRVRLFSAGKAAFPLPLSNYCPLWRVTGVPQALLALGRWWGWWPYWQGQQESLTFADHFLCSRPSSRHLCIKRGQQQGVAVPGVLLLLRGGAPV